MSTTPFGHLLFILSVSCLLVSSLRVVRLIFVEGMGRRFFLCLPYKWLSLHTRRNLTHGLLASACFKSTTFVFCCFCVLCLMCFDLSRWAFFVVAAVAIAPPWRPSNDPHLKKRLDAVKTHALADLKNRDQRAEGQDR